VTMPEWHTFWGFSTILPELVSQDTGLLAVHAGDSCWAVDGSDYVYALCLHSASQPHTASDGLNDISFKHRRLFGFLFSLSFGDSREDAGTRAAASFTFQDLQALARKKMKFFSPASLTGRVPAEWGPLAGKCLSVIKVNTLAAEGSVLGKFHWSTPDRLPHRFMWLWDSVFHALGMVILNGPLAQELLSSVLEELTPEGLISIQMLPSGPQNPSMTQPPILAWGVWRVFSLTGDVEWLREVYPGLVKYLDWDFEHRDSNNNLLLEWTIKPWSRFCKSAESGMDNSPRFDSGRILDSVDFSVYAAQDLFSLGKIGAVVGKPREAQRHHQMAEDVTEAIHSILWDEELGFYFDKPVLNASDVSQYNLPPFRQVFASSGLLPLLLPPSSFPHSRAERLVEVLMSPDHFWTSFPVPSVSTSDPEWTEDMWRGPTWANVNYLLNVALNQQGYAREAGQLALRHLEVVREVYQSTGSLWESYDSRNLILPDKLKKKGKQVGAVCDLQWTASVTLLLLNENVVSKGYESL